MVQPERMPVRLGLNDIMTLTFDDKCLQKRKTMVTKGCKEGRNVTTNNLVTRAGVTNDRTLDLIQILTLGIDHGLYMHSLEPE